VPSRPSTASREQPGGPRRRSTGSTGNSSVVTRPDQLRALSPLTWRGAGHHRRSGRRPSALVSSPETELRPHPPLQSTNLRPVQPLTPWLSPLAKLGPRYWPHASGRRTRDQARKDPSACRLGTTWPFPARRGATPRSPRLGLPIATSRRPAGGEVIQPRPAGSSARSEMPSFRQGPRFTGVSTAPPEPAHGRRKGGGGRGYDVRSYL